MRGLNSKVYYLWDYRGSLLYIGCSMTPGERVKAHRRKPWGPDIYRVTTTDSMPMRDAYAFEHEEIFKRKPRHNIASKNGLLAHEMAALHNRRYTEADISKALGKAAA